MVVPIARKIVEIIEIEDAICNGWESDFIHSIAKQFDETHSLSDKQLAMLDKLYARACDSDY